MKQNLLIVSGIIVVALMFFVNSKRSNTDVSTSKYNIGDKAIDFKLKNIDEQFVSLEDYPEAKGFVVVFTCNTCPFSKWYEQRIIDLDVKYKSLGYPVVAINPNDKEVSPGDSFEEMKSRATSKGYTFPYLYDESQEIAQTYGATRTPHVYILIKESDGFKVAYIGAIDNNHKDAAAADKKYVEDALENLIEGNTVSTNFTKAIGCTIKWSNS
jgi:peroxiredoxin